MKEKLLEYAALSGDWSVIKKDTLTIEDLDCFKHTKTNLLETIGANGNILKLPPELIGEEGILYQDESLRIRTIHLATENGSLSIIPKKHLTQENLRAKEPLYGYSTFHYAARHGCLNDIPKELLTEENLTLRSSNGQTPFNLAFNMLYAFKKSKDPNNLKKVRNVTEGINIILKSFSDKTLEEAKDWNIDNRALDYIHKEITRRKIIKSLNKKERSIEI